MAYEMVPILLGLVMPIPFVGYILTAALILVAHKVTWKELFLIVYIPGMVHLLLLWPRMVASYFALGGPVESLAREFGFGWAWALPLVYGFVQIAAFSVALVASFAMIYVVNRILPKKFKNRIDRLG